MDTVDALVSTNRFTSAADVILGDGVRLPAATSSSGGDTIEPLKTPSIFNQQNQKQIQKLKLKLKQNENENENSLSLYLWIVRRVQKLEHGIRNNTLGGHL